LRERAKPQDPLAAHGPPTPFIHLILIVHYCPQPPSGTPFASSSFHPSGLPVGLAWTVPLSERGRTPGQSWTKSRCLDKTSGRIPTVVLQNVAQQHRLEQYHRQYHQQRVCTDLSRGRYRCWVLHWPWAGQVRTLGTVMSRFLVLLSPNSRPT
jgi:hypothetical protein